MPKTKKSQSKVISKGVIKRPRWQIMVAALLLIVIVSVGGTFLYTKHQQNDIKAKAAAFLFRAEDYTRSHPAIKLAICKNSSNVIGIATKPMLFEFNDNREHTLWMYYHSGATGSDKGETGRGNSAWFDSNPDAISFIAAPINYSRPWVNLSFVSEPRPSLTPRATLATTKRVHINFIPRC